MKIYLLLILGAVLPSVQGVCAPDKYETADVVVVGAGMAGINTAKTLLSRRRFGLNVKILESTDRIGGRVHSKFDFGENGSTIEECASWVAGTENVFELAQDYGLKFTFQDYNDYDGSIFSYDSSDTPAGEAGTFSDRDTRLAGRTLRRSYNCMIRAAFKAYVEQPRRRPDDEGIITLLNECGFDIDEAPEALGSLYYLFQWMAVDFSSAVPDVSIYEVVPTDGIESYFISDPDGFQSLVERFAADTPLPVDHLIDFNERVQYINYGLTDGDYRAEVISYNEVAGTCTSYKAKYVVSTVSVGVLNEELIEFDPPLAFEPATYNPLKMEQYVRIFYEFADIDEPFWNDDSQFIAALDEDPLSNIGKCHHWQNLNGESNVPGRKTRDRKAGASNEFLKDSKILMCTLLTADMVEIFGVSEDELKDVSFTEEQLLDLLTPLEHIYEEVPTPTDIYYNTAHSNVDYGFGAFGAWEIGVPLSSYYKFFGSYDADLVEPCGHNGCFDDEWVLHLSGSASCFEQYEYVEGAFLSGLRTGLNILFDLGERVDLKYESGCEDFEFFFSLV